MLINLLFFKRFSLLDKVAALATERGVVVDPRDEFDPSLAFYHLPAGQHLLRERGAFVNRSSMSVCFNVAVCLY